MEEYCLVTPTHTSKLTVEEVLNLRISLSYHSNVVHYFCIPFDLPINLLQDIFPNSKFIQFKNSHFENVQSYNRLLISSEFYKQFLSFKFVVILQLDAILIKNIEPSLKLDFDYIGAPWLRKIRVSIFNRRLHGNNKRLFWLPFHTVQVGNGGLSVRKIESMIRITERLKLERFSGEALSGNQNEDFVISYMCKKLKLNVPDVETAESIFIEQYTSRRSHEIEPYGYHALQKYDLDKYVALLKNESKYLNFR